MAVKSRVPDILQSAEFQPFARSPSLRRWALWLLALSLWLVLAAAASAALWHLRSKTLESQAHELNTLSMAMTDAIDRGLGDVNENLYILRTELQEGDILTESQSAGDALRKRARMMPWVRAIWLLNDSGETVASASSDAAPEMASFSPGLEKLGENETAVSRTFSGTADGSPQLVALATRRLDAPGWVVIAMSASSLLSAFESTVSSGDTRLLVLRSDGARLAAVNMPNDQVLDQEIAQLRETQPGLAVRQFEGSSENLMALRWVSPYRINVLLTQGVTSQLQSWRDSVDAVAASLGLLLVITGAAVYLVQRANIRHAASQQALSAQASRSSKLESLGTLAGGVAHDFNNVLAGIVGYGEMAQDAAPKGSKQARHLNNLLQAANRGKLLVERILAFSRGGARNLTVFELEPVVQEVLTLLSASLRPGVVLERALHAPGSRIYGDSTQVFEAILNLCTNALQAMPGGGMLSVQLKRRRMEVPQVLSHSQLVMGDYLELSVSDQGSGITPEVMERLFEPFFTTRAAQSGTGLGLAVVFGVVTEARGAIDVTSTPGQGAKFILYFSESAEPLNAPSLPPIDRAHLLGTGERVMVLDDEPSLVAMTADMLKALGYVPVCHTDPRTALQALLADPQAVVAVITDEVMPGLTGTQLTQALRRAAPDLPVLLVSGYGGVQLAERALAMGVTRVLAKPLQRAALASALAEVLASR